MFWTRTPALKEWVKSGRLEREARKERREGDKERQRGRRGKKSEGGWDDHTAV